MAASAQPVKMTPVEAEDFESIGYVPGVRKLYIKFRNAPALTFNNVPGFRFEGLLAAPRKDAYYKTFIKDVFLSKPADLPPQVRH